MKPTGSRTILKTQDAPSTSKKLLACVSYGTVSISITLFNKAVFSVYGFHFPNFVTTLQIVVSICYMHLLQGIGAFQFSPVTLKGARQVGVAALRTYYAAQTCRQNICIVADFTAGVLLVVVCCFWGNSFAIFDSSNVQVGVASRHQHLNCNKDLWSRQLIRCQYLSDAVCSDVVRR